MNLSDLFLSHSIHNYYSRTLEGVIHNRDSDVWIVVFQLIPKVKSTSLENYVNSLLYNIYLDACRTSSSVSYACTNSGRHLDPKLVLISEQTSSSIIVVAYAIAFSVPSRHFMVVVVVASWTPTGKWGVPYSVWRRDPSWLYFSLVFWFWESQVGGIPEIQWFDAEFVWIVRLFYI